MDDTILIMFTAGVAAVSGVVNDTVNVKYNAQTKKSTASLSKPKLKPIIGGFLVGIFLFGANAISEQVTHALCVLIIIVSLMRAMPSLLTAAHVGGFS